MKHEIAEAQVQTMQVHHTATTRVNSSGGVAQKSGIGPKSTVNDVKQRLTKAHWVQPERE